MFGKLHHVGHIVKNFEEGLKLYKNKFGLTPEGDIIELTSFGSRIIFFPFGDTIIELIEPAAPPDPAGRCLKERGEGLFHLSFLADDYDKEVKELREKGFTVEEYTLDGVFPGYTPRIAFLAPEETQGIWIEIMDPTTSPPDTL